jgi:hypothetical protein
MNSAGVTQEFHNLMSKINELPPSRQHDEFMGLYPASQRAARQMLDNRKIFEDPLAFG